MDDENLFKSSENLEGYIDRIRELYLMHKELKSRHELSMDPRTKSRSHKIVYSSKQETGFMKDPDSQKLLREQIIGKISEVPTLKPIQFYPDFLLSEYLTSELHTSPSEIRIVLADFFKEQICNLQQLKHKILLKWAFLTESTLESTSIEISEKLKKLHIELDDNISRFERLRYDEEFDGTRVRPSPKTEDGTNLFHEEPVVYFSSIAKDDIEKYIENEVETLKVNRVVDRFLARLKWQWVSQRIELWKKSIFFIKDLFEKSVNQMKNLRGIDVSTSADTKVKENIDLPPMIITSTFQLQQLLNETGKDFGLQADLELDDGHSLSYQVTHLLPELFELQRQRLDWNPYGSQEEREKAAIRLSNLHSLKVHRLTAIRKANAVAQFAESEEFNILKKFQLLDAKDPEWLGLVKLKPEITIWQRRQKARLEGCRKDHLLENAFNVLNLHDLPTINKLLEEFSVSYQERANKVLKVKPELINPKSYMKSYFTSIIKDRNLDPKIQNDGINLPSQCIKSLYTLRMIKSRDLKQKLFDILNVFRSIQKRITYDINDLGTREELRPDCEFSEIPRRKSGFNPILPYFDLENKNFTPEKFPGLYGRQDTIEKINGDYYIKNNRGLYIVYTIIDSDYKEIVEELVKIGSFYIEKYETMDSQPYVDRDFFAAEILEEEVKFQEAKLDLVLLYLEIYEHTVDAQVDLCQKITDLMGLRPRLHLRGSYFSQGYWAHTAALQKHYSLLRTIIDSFSFTAKSDLLIDKKLPNLLNISKTIENSLCELNLYLDIESPLHYSAIEYSIWDLAKVDWQKSQCFSLAVLDEGVLLDNPKFVMEVTQELSNEAKSGNISHFPIIPLGIYEGKKVKIQTICPSELTIVCNYFEAWRFRKLLEKAIVECVGLEEIYKKQSVTMKKDIMSVEQADWGVGLRHFSEVDDGPGTKTEFWLPAFELDSKLKANFDFSSISALKQTLLPWGIEELRAIYSYQILHKHLLTIGVQINRNLLDKPEKQIAEIEVFRGCNYLSNSFLFPISTLQKDFTLEKSESEIKKIHSRIIVESAKFYFDTKSKKIRNRQKLDGVYKRIAEKYKKPFGETDYIGILMRNLRVSLVDGYCQEVLRDAYHDAIKVQLCKVYSEYRRVLKIVPVDVYKDTFEMADDKPRVMVDEFLNIEFMPTVEEIMKLKGFRDEDKENWKHWEPFAKAGTPDLFTSKPPRSKEQIFSIMQFKNHWEFLSPLRTTLEISISIVQVIQIWTFLNMLGEKVSEVMNLYDTSQAGENYWDSKTTGEKSKKKILDEMLDTQNPKYLLEEAVKRSLSNLKSMTYQYQDTPRSDETQLAIFQSKRAFFILSLAVFQSLHHSLMHEKSKDSTEVIEFITQLFRYSRRKFNLFNAPIAPLFSNPSCEVVEICQRTVHIVNEENTGVAGCYIWEFEWGMLEVASEERNHTLAATTAMQLKMENLLSMRFTSKSLNSLDIAAATCAYITPELECWRLKTALFVLKTGDLVSDPSVYEKLLSQYKDVLEWKTERTFHADSEDIKNPILAEVSLLKDTFNAKICSSTIKFLQDVMESLTRAGGIEGTFSSADNFTCNIVKPYTDIQRKVGVLNNFLNVLRNRGSMVDAPGTGKALVFSVKDLTQLTKRITEQILRYLDGEFRIQQENHDSESQRIISEVLKKNREIMMLRRNVHSLQSNIANLVSAQLAQKGNQLIYELDISARQLAEIKNNTKQLEKQVVSLVRQEFTQEILSQQSEIQRLENKFNEYRGEVAQEIKSDIDTKKIEALNDLKGNASKYKNINSSEIREENHKLIKTKPTLVRIQETIRKMLYKNQWDRLQTTQKYDKHLQDLKAQLSSNQYLWEQLNESQRRESLLKQELSYTQQALSAAEKLAEKLQTQIEDMNSQRQRLQNYKANKGKKLSELEEQVKQYEKIEFLDSQKLLNHYMQQTKRIKVQKNGDLEGYKQYLSQHNGYQREIIQIKKRISKEKKLKIEAYDQLNLFKEEMQGIDQEQDPTLKLWQGRYYELLDEVRNNKEDNMRLRERFVEQGDYEFIDKFPDLIRPKSEVSFPSVHIRTPRSTSFVSSRN